MKIDPLTNKEDQQFTEHVVAYNNEPDKEKKARLYEGIRDRTTLLIFLISKRKLLLSSDEATSILLECEKDLDHIISAFKVAKCSYNTYLFQTCRYRGRRLMRDKFTRVNTETNLMREDAVTYYVEDRYNEDVYRLPVLPSASNDDLLAMTIKELFQYIIATRDRKDYPVFTNSEYMLRKVLENPLERKYFLILLLSVPDHGDDEDAQNYARVFQTDEEAFQCLFQRRREQQMNKNQRYDENMRLANKHWRLMTDLKSSIEREMNTHSRNQMIANYQKQSISHKRRLYDVSKCRRGLSHEEIGKLLGYSRPTISTYAASARKMLKGVMEFASVSREGFEVSSLDDALRKK